MADNLSIGISVDAAKAKADLKLFNAEIANTTKLMRDAVKAGDPAAVNAQHQALQGLYQQQAKTTAVIKADTAAKYQNTAATNQATKSAREFGLELGHLAHAAGLPIEGLRALRAGFIAFAAVEVIRGVTSAISKITELSEAAAKAGTTVEMLKSLQSAMRATGQNADDAAPLLAKFSETLRQSRLTPVFDPKGPIESLMGTSALAYRPGAEGDARAARDAARELLRMRGQGRIDEANEASQRIFGQTVDQNLKLIQQIANDALPKVAAATKEDIAIQEQYVEQVAKAKDAWDGVLEVIGRVGMAGAVAGSKIQGLPTPPGAGTVETGGTFAAGGPVRGSGTGTSDSILARLSNGEFVINAASTRRWGTNFLNGINSFAAGGLVNVPPIRFAEGGLVPGFAGGGQAMAAFHFESGNSFRLGGPVDVVNAMVSEAHAQQVRSAGVKPSWYAARPSGR